MISAKPGRRRIFGPSGSAEEAVAQDSDWRSPAAKSGVKKRRTADNAGAFIGTRVVGSRIRGRQRRRVRTTPAACREQIRSERPSVTQATICPGRDATVLPEIRLSSQRTRRLISQYRVRGRQRIARRKGWGVNASRGRAAFLVRFES